MITPEHQHIAAEAGKILFSAIAGAVISRRFEGKANLITNWGPVSAYSAKDGAGKPFAVHTHEVVLRNAGRKAATNVRLTHHVLPEFKVYPSVLYSVEELPDGTRDIVLPQLVPGQQITVGYLYFPPTVYTNINAGIRSDEGFAKEVVMELIPKTSKRMVATVVSLMIIGAGTLCYWAFKGLERLGM
jgi:hypothetical protein